MLQNCIVSYSGRYCTHTHKIAKLRHNVEKYRIKCKLVSNLHDTNTVTQATTMQSLNQEQDGGVISG